MANSATASRISSAGLRAKATSSKQNAAALRSAPQVRVSRSHKVQYRSARSNRNVVRAASMEEQTKQMAEAERRWQANVREGRVRSVSAEEAVSLVQSGEYALLDVRPAEEVEKGKVEGSVDVPLFVIDDDISPGGLLKQMSAFGMGGWWLGGSHMKPNETFLPAVLNSVPTEKPVIVACQKGLRSLAACEQLSRGGYQQIAWLNGGFEAAEKGVIPTTDGQDIRLAGIGGLSAVIGWTPLQQAEGASITDGPFGNVLKVAGFIVVLDTLAFAFEFLNASGN